MAIYRASISFQIDSELPRDAVSINPHYFGDNAQGLADALKANILANVHIGVLTPFRVRIYDAQKAPPSYPLAEASNVAAALNTNLPREVTLCLSYYSNFNRPSYRGRLYIPGFAIGGPFTLRPSDSQIDNALAWGTTLTNALPANHNWVVYSRKLGQSFGVNRIWVNDEWDIQRSRGLRETKRHLANVP